MASEQLSSHSVHGSFCPWTSFLQNTQPTEVFLVARVCCIKVSVLTKFWSTETVTPIPPVNSHPPPTSLLHTHYSHLSCYDIRTIYFTSHLVS